MKPVLTKRQAEVLLAIKRYSFQHGYSPSYREIQEILGINSPNGVACHIKALTDKGYLKRHDKQKARSFVVVGDEDEMHKAWFIITAMLPMVVDKYPAVAELALQWLKRNARGSQDQTVPGEATGPVQTDSPAEVVRRAVLDTV